MQSHHGRPGSLIGGMLLVAGSCIGAGMLALPILTGLAGFFPSLAMLFLAWAGMTFTAFLLIEINGWFSKRVNLLSMTERTLGKAGRSAAWISYLFLFYTLLLSYISASGTVFAAIFEALFRIQISAPLASTFFTALFGWIIYLDTRPVDMVNRVLMGGLIAAYFGMIGLGLFSIDPKYLLHSNTSALLTSLPVLVVSFGFHNLIPSLTAYMKGDLKRVRLTILGGSLMVLGVYILWSLFVLGIVPYSGSNGILAQYQQGHEATIALKAILGANWIGYFAQGFAFFAIVTSFLAQGLTLTHFLADGFNLEVNKRTARWIVPIVLIPPLIFALFYPNIFLHALGFAGGICAMILFGILPVLMVWVGRYKKKFDSTYQLKGGKFSLALGLAFSLLVIGRELMRIF